MAGYGTAIYGADAYALDITPPPVPTGLTITVGVGQVTLNWDDHADAAEHLVVFSTDGLTGWSYTPGSPVVASTLTVTGLAAGTTYWFQVAARDASGNTSDYTAAVSGTPTAVVPDPRPELKPPLDLFLEVTQPDGRTFIWDSTAVAGSIPQSATFRTRRGDGFADGSVTLSRRIDRDYADVQLLDSFAFVGADGSVAYEARLGAAPRSMGDTHSITCQLAGWMSHAKDRKFTWVGVDRDLKRWTPMSRQRRLTLLGVPAGPHDPSTAQDETSGMQAVILAINDPPTTRQVAEAMYDAGPGHRVASVYYNLQRTNTAAPWEIRLYVGDNDQEYLDASANLAGTGNTAAFYNPTTARRFAHLLLDSQGTTDANPHEAAWRQLAVYGDHGLTRRGSDPGGLYASDIMKHIIGNYAPRLNTSGINDTNYAIPHVAFHEHVFPYDALLDLNKHHLWELAVWENRTLHYGPHDLTDYDWEVRLSDHGVTVDLQGDSVEDLANGILVSYQDAAKGTQHTLEPPDHAELRDDDPLNPANRAGLDKWTEVRLSSPSTEDAALQIGRTILAEYNQPKAPGTIHVRGHIRDRAGNWQQVWKVRAGDTVAVTDHPNSRPRLIMETTYNHDRHDLTIAVDATMRRTDAILDRLATAMAAANL